MIQKLDIVCITKGKCVPYTYFVDANKDEDGRDEPDDMEDETEVRNDLRQDVNITVLLITHCNQ